MIDVRIARDEHHVHAIPAPRRDFLRSHGEELRSSKFDLVDGAGH